MDIFSNLDCMVVTGALTEAQANSFKLTMAGLTGASEKDLLLFLLATQLQNLNSSATQLPIFVDSAHNATNGNVIMADTTGGAFTITLPANPSVGDRVDIYDAQSNFATDNLTVARNGELIDSAASDLVANLDNVHLAFVFQGGAQGWSVYNG